MKKKNVAIGIEFKLYQPYVHVKVEFAVQLTFA
jgi:hypothetical protein